MLKNDTLTSLSAAFLIIALASGFSSPMFALATNNDDDSVIICHESGANNWTQIPVDENSIDGNGGGDHNNSSHQDGEDIIPPGDWDPDGRNWDAEGQAIYNNECVVPAPTPTPTPTHQQKKKQNKKQKKNKKKKKN